MLFVAAQVRNCSANRLALATDGTAAPWALPAEGQPVSLITTCRAPATFTTCWYSCCREHMALSIDVPSQ